MTVARGAGNRHRRCTLPASGFYEWSTAGGKKVPHRFRLADGGVMGFAGLWSKWKGAADGPALFTCCLIPTAANDVVRPFHDRMPAILAKADYDRWFDANTPLKELTAMLKPYPAELMEAGAANPLVNSPRNEGPQLPEPAA